MVDRLHHCAILSHALLNIKLANKAGLEHDGLPTVGPQAAHAFRVSA